MLFSKANLEVSSIASRSADDIGINCLRLNPDGSTVATNGKVVMAVSPVDTTKIHFPDVGKQTEPRSYSAAGVSIPLEAVDKVIKQIPRDKRLALQHVAMCEDREPRKVKFTTTDMNHEQSISVFPKSDPFPEWEAIFTRIRSENAIKLCVSRKDLMELLSAMEAACPDRGAQNPVWLEIHPEGKGMVLRCQNRESGQRAIGVVTSYNTDGQWMPTDEWERSIFGFASRTLKSAVTTIKKFVRING